MHKSEPPFVEKNSEVSLLNISVNSRHAVMEFVLEYVKTHQVLSSLVPHSAGVVDAHY
jgi:hypothetical protein